MMVTQLVTLTPDMDVFEAIGLLLRNKISGAPVVDGDENFVGVFSERCCLEVLVKAAYEQVPSTSVFPFIEADAPTIHEETDILEIARTFLRTATRRLPVLRGTKLVGQISRRDVLKHAHTNMHVAPTTEARLLYISSLFEHHEAPI
jgi:CBS domain-containing protein